MHIQATEHYSQRISVAIFNFFSLEKSFSNSAIVRVALLYILSCKLNILNLSKRSRTQRSSMPFMSISSVAVCKRYSWPIA